VDGNRQKYVELSLAGKWVSLAREIILDNPGIEKSRFIEIAAPLMPTHIDRRNGKKIPQVKLATDSIRHLVKLHKSVLLVDGKLTSKAREAAAKGYGKEILELASINGTVRATDLPHIKYFSALAFQLCKRKLLRKVEKGVFAVKKTKEDATLTEGE
jgi:hypothetical protein